MLLHSQSCNNNHSPAGIAPWRQGRRLWQPHHRPRLVAWRSCCWGSFPSRWLRKALSLGWRMRWQWIICKSEIRILSIIPRQLRTNELRGRSRRSSSPTIARWMSLQTRGKLPAVRFPGAGLLFVGFATSQNAICRSWFWIAETHSVSSICEQLPWSVCALLMRFCKSPPVNTVQPLNAKSLAAPDWRLEWLVLIFKRFEKREGYLVVCLTKDLIQILRS